MLQKSKAFPSGQVLILGLVFLAVISLATVSLVTYEGTYVQLARKNYEKEKALEMAEAGLNKAIWSLNQTGGVYSGETFNFGNGVVVVQVTDLDPKNKLLEATGYLPDNLSPRVQKKIRIKTSAEPPTTSVGFHYGVQVGEGGVTMENGSLINGNVYSNGNFQGAGVGKSIITGGAWVAGGGAAVADQAEEFYNSDFIFGRNTPQIDAAQSFRPTTTGFLNKVSLFMKKTGQPPNLTIYLVLDNFGQPSKLSLGQATLRASLVTGEYGWVEASFSLPPLLFANIPYWLVVDASKDSDDYWIWARDSLDSYERGTAFYSPDWQAKTPSWTPLSADLDFKVWLGGIPTFIMGVSVNGSAHANSLIGSAIGADAYYQNLILTTVGGVKYPNSPDPGPQDFPISEGNLSDWKQAAAAGGTIAGDFHPAGGDIITLGPKKITGNLLLDNNQTLIITGTVWVQGNIDISNNGTIRLDAGYQENSGIILADGWMHLKNNGSFSGSGDDHSFLILISLAPCQGGEQTPSCANHNAAVDLHNNVDSTIFYAPRGLVYLHNRVEVQELTAYKIHLSENTEIDYESGLASVFFTNGPGGAWQAVKGYWQEIK